jgi:hypothetical protein
LAAVPETSGWCTVLAGLDVGRLPTWEYMEQKKDATSDHIEEPWCEWLVLRAFLYARDPARPAKAKPPTVPAKAYRFTVPDWVAPTVDGMLNGRAVVVPESATKPVACRWRVIWAVANQDLAGARAALERVPAGQDRAAAEVFLAWAESQGVESLAAHPVWGRRTPATSQTDPPAAPPHPEKPRPETPRREPPAHPPSPEPPRPEPTGASGF